MSSKPKRSKTYIVLHLATGGRYKVWGRYRVGAKNPRQAEEFLRDKIGEHMKVRTYFEEKRYNIPFGTVEQDEAYRTGVGGDY